MQNTWLVCSEMFEWFIFAKLLSQCLWHLRILEKCLWNLKFGRILVIFSIWGNVYLAVILAKFEQVHITFQYLLGCEHLLVLKIWRNYNYLYPSNVKLLLLISLQLCKSLRLIDSCYNETGEKIVWVTFVISFDLTPPKFFITIGKNGFVLLHTVCKNNISQLNKFCFWFIIVDIAIELTKTRKCQVPAQE